MKIVLKGKEIELASAEVKFCKKLVNEFIKNIREQSEHMHMPQIYFTALILMHMISGELLNKADPESLNKLLESIAASQKKNNIS